VRETLEKKAFQHLPEAKKRLRKRAHVLFSAPILMTREHGTAFTVHYILEE
jgi:hypothetical protein